MFFCEHFSQNSGSFWSLSWGKLEAGGCFNLIVKKKAIGVFHPGGASSSCWLSPLSPQGFGEQQAPKTTNHREAPWASEEEREERERKQAAFTLSHIITHNKVIAARFHTLSLSLRVAKVLDTICSFK